MMLEMISSPNKNNREKFRKTAATSLDFSHGLPVKMTSPKQQNGDIKEFLALIEENDKVSSGGSLESQEESVDNTKTMDKSTRVQIDS